MATNQPIVKIYEIKTLGYDTVHSQFLQVSADLAKIKKQLLDLRATQLTTNDLKQQEAINKKILEAAAAYEETATAAKQLQNEEKVAINLRKQEIEFLKAAGDQSAKSVIGNRSAHLQLIQTYKDAKANAENLAAEYGVESEAAIKAAEAAAVYKNQLLEIQRLLKTGGKPATPTAPVQPEVPFTTNLDQLEAEKEALNKTGEALSDFNRKQAIAANEAVAWGQAQKAATDGVEESSESIQAIQTKYQEFTGTMRDNLRVQIENDAALKANRASQKEIEKAIGASGQATQGQVERLAKLKEEEQLLVATNKELSVTIRNQAREFIAAAGSLDEQQAQLNQLQQAYEQLSATEKASPFGQQMKAEIDQLEPKVKALEAELGKFSRNVGNYPTIFGGAFRVLNKELDTVQAKLVSGDFSGKQLDELIAQEKVLANATRVLGAEFSSTTKQQAAFKEAGRQIAITFGTDSQVFKDFSKQVAAGNAALKQTDVQLIKASGSGKTFTGVLSFLYGGLRKLANLIPGLGISSLLLLIITPLQSLASELFNFGNKAKEAGDKLKVFGEIKQEAFKNSAEEILRVNALVAAARNENLARDQRNAAINELQKKYPEYLSNITLEKINSEQATAAINKLTEAILQKAVADEFAKRAAGAIIKQKDIENKLRKEEQKLVDQNQAFQDKLNKAIRDNDKASISALKRYGPLTEITQRNIHNLKEDLTEAKKEVGDLTEGFNEATLAALAFVEKPKKEKGSAISIFDQEELKLIEANRSRLIAIENKRVNEIQKIRELSLDEEIEHLKKVEAINIDALKRSIDIINRKKKLNAEEQKTVAEFQEKISSIELDVSRKINDIEKKRFDSQVKALQESLDQELKAIAANKQAVIDNIDSTELQKSEAQLAADEKELQARETFYNALLLLNDRYNKEAIAKAKEGIEGINKAITSDRNKVTTETIEEIKRRGQQEVQAEQIKAGILRNAILNNQKITSARRKKQLEDLQKAEEKTILAIELKTIQAVMEVTKILYAFGLVTEQQFQAAQKQLIDKANELADKISKNDEAAKEKLKKKFTDLKTLIQSGLRDLFNFDENSDEDKFLGDFIAQSYDLALSAMNAFYDAERQRIQDNLEIQLQRIETEKEQVTARAQSQAEIDSIEKQYAEKKKAAEKKAGEQLKDVKRKEAKIALATELANIWSTVWQLGPVAGPIAGALFSGLALARYAVRLGEINSQKFEFGGQIGKRKTRQKPAKTGTLPIDTVSGSDVPLRGGKFKGKPHIKGGTPFMHKGREYEAEVDEIAVIRTRNAPKNKRYTVTGNQMQIASAINVAGGGVDFYPGAKIKKFESGGYIGQNLRAPIFPSPNSSVINNIRSGAGMSEQQFDRMIERLEAITDQQSRWASELQVIQVTDTVTAAQHKRVKQRNIGSIV